MSAGAVPSLQKLVASMVAQSDQIDASEIKKLSTYVKEIIAKELINAPDAKKIEACATEVLNIIEKRLRSWKERYNFAKELSAVAAKGPLGDPEKKALKELREKVTKSKEKYDALYKAVGELTQLMAKKKGLALLSKSGQEIMLLLNKVNELRQDITQVGHVLFSIRA
jgi:hypothetical protein